MLKVLLKKQMLEINRSFFYNPKEGKMRSKLASTVYIVFYVLLMVGIMGGIFTMLSLSMCSVFAEAKLGWLYFIIMSAIAIALGTFGSVFNTFSGLYKAKDNDLLLSLPIPAHCIMASRLLGVYLMGLMFSAVVMVPAVVVYLFTVPITLKVVIGSVGLVILVSFIVLVLSCLLGWIVAKISNKLKNKSFITVFVALVFFAAYYLFFLKASELLNKLIAAAVTIGTKIKGEVYPLYLFGRAGEGDMLALLATAAIIVVLMAAIWVVLSHGFIKIATASEENANKIHRENYKMRVNSLFKAMLGKEFARFTSSPNYMLNCGLGTVLLPVAGVLLLIKGKSVVSMLSMALQINSDFIAILFICALCALASMNDMTSPSVSLEGKSIWIAQSLPITTWQILKAKLAVQILLTAIPMLICCVCAVIVFKPNIILGIFMFVMPMAYMLLSACFGLFMNLLRPNLTWTNEIAPIKQSMAALCALFGGWVYSLVFVGLFYLLRHSFNAGVYLLCFTVLTCTLIYVLVYWLKHRGTKIFASL